MLLGEPASQNMMASCATVSNGEKSARWCILWGHLHTLPLGVQALSNPQRPQVVVDCAVKLVRAAAMAEQVATANDLPATLDALGRLGASSNTGMLAHLVSIALAKRAQK